MSPTLFAILALVYFLGVITVQWLDKVFYLEHNKYHHIILLIIWIATPIILVAFIFYMFWIYIKKAFKR